MVVAGLAQLSGCQWLNPRYVSQRARADSREAIQEAGALFAQGRLEDAESRLNRAAKLCPANAEARVMLAEAAWQRGDVEQAIGHLEAAAAATDREDGALLERIGNLALMSGRFAFAQDSVSKAINADPTLSEAWRLEAMLAYRIGDTGRELAALQRVTQLRPDDTQALLRAATIYRERGAPGKSLACLHLLANVYPPDEIPRDALVMTGLNLLDLGENAEAAIVLSGVADRPPPSAEIYYLLGMARMANGERRAAMDAVDRAMRIDPTHGPSLVFLQRHLPAFDRPQASMADVHARSRLPAVTR